LLDADLFQQVDRLFEEQTFLLDRGSPQDDNALIQSSAMLIGTIAVT
jgi:hypothetical protein